MDIITLAKELVKLNDSDLVLLNEKIGLFNLSIIDVKNQKQCFIPKEEKLYNLLFGLKEKGFDKDNNFKDGIGVKLLYYDSKNKVLYVSYYNIWLVFEEEFNMEYDEIKEFITKYVVDTLQIEVSYTYATY